jgi:Uncharacterized proteins, homologs of lactam utilization protein B
MRRVDLNCDVGEGVGNDRAIMPWITSANIACGAHAGDVETMRETVRLAREFGVAVGAHPGFADRANFGRKEIALAPEEIETLVREQVRALCAIGEVRHVKPHGALYNIAAREEAVAAAIARAVRTIDGKLVLVGLAGGALVRAGRACGLRVAEEVFADRRYRADGTLVPRSDPRAVIAETDEAVEQVLRMVNDGEVCAADGGRVKIVADTICLHGDGAHAAVFAQRIRAALERAGVTVAAGN